MASPVPSVSESPPTDAEQQNEDDSSPEEGKENLQGPHDWRKRLKPITKQGSTEIEEPCTNGKEEEENGEPSGESPAVR